MSDLFKTPRPSPIRSSGMKLQKLTTLLVVDRIDACLPTWEKLGYSVATRVPDQGVADFVILIGPPGELMLQSRSSLTSDLPDVAARRPAYLLYADVASLEAARESLAGATVIVPRRTTSYGATEAWFELAGGTVIGLGEHAK
jgi:hypothetical protein